MDKGKIGEKGMQPHNALRLVEILSTTAQLHAKSRLQCVNKHIPTTFSQVQELERFHTAKLSFKAKHHNTMTFLETWQKIQAELGFPVKKIK